MTQTFDELHATVNGLHDRVNDMLRQIAVMEGALNGLRDELADLRRRVDLLEGRAPELLSTAEAAEMLGVHVNTVKQMIGYKRLPATRIGRNWKIQRADVLAMLESHKRKTQP